MHPQNDSTVSPLADLDALLRRRAQADAEFSTLLLTIGRWLASCAAAPAVAAAPQPAPSITPEASQISHSLGTEPLAGTVAQTPAAPSEPSVAAAASPPASPADLQRLLSTFSGVVSPKISQTSPTQVLTEPMAEPTAEPTTLEELEAILPRFELKADACAWAIRRERASSEGRGFEPVRPEYETLRDRADTMQPCYLWMIHHESSFITAEHWTLLEGCYRGCAQVLRTITEFPDQYGETPALLRLLCEAQSAIYAAMTSSDASPRWVDRDLDIVFKRCLTEVKDRDVFSEHLSKNNLANPRLHAGLLARARKLHEELAAVRERKNIRKKGINVIAYHLKLLPLDLERQDHHWKRIGDGIEEVRRSGTPASDTDLVDLLSEAESITDEMPDEVADRPLIAEVLRYVDAKLAATQVKQPERPRARREATPEMIAVRQSLRGKTVVIIGGDERPHSRENIEREFELAELKWLTSREHSSIEHFRAALIHPDTALVMLMIRWASHSYEAVQEICEPVGKPFVRLPGGYNPSQLAHQIVLQASDLLGIDPPNA